MTAHPARAATQRLTSHLLVAAVAALAWLRADGEHDDRGSDSTEKAMMIILGLTIAGLVTAATIALVKDKISLFK